jgi:hypothetical protein
MTLALLSLALAGCVVEPGRGYGDRGYGDRGYGGRGYGDYRWHNGDRAEYRPVYGQQGYWNR